MGIIFLMAICGFITCVMGMAVIKLEQARQRAVSDLALLSMQVQTIQGELYNDDLGEIRHAIESIKCDLDHWTLR